MGKARTNMTEHAARKIAEWRIKVWPDYEAGTAIVFNSKTRRRSVNLSMSEAVETCRLCREEEVLDLLNPKD